MKRAYPQNDKTPGEEECRPGRAHQRQHGSIQRAHLVAFLCFSAALLLACRAASDLPDSNEIAQYNAYWNCPTPSPVPTQCWQEPYPGPTAGPGSPTPEPVL